MSNEVHPIVVSTCQRGNPLLKVLRQPLEASDTTIWDYEIRGKDVYILFVTIRYFGTKQEYLAGRMKRKGIAENRGLKILLCFYDAELTREESNVNEESLQAINATAFHYGFTTLFAWSFEEAARHMEVLRRRYQRFESLKGRSISTKHGNSVNSTESILSTLRSVNRPNAAKLLSRFSTVKDLCVASQSSLTAIPGIGQVKAQEMAAVFQAPLRHSDSETSLRVVKEQQAQVRLARNFPKPAPKVQHISYSNRIIDHTPTREGKQPIVYQGNSSGVIVHHTPAGSSGQPTVHQGNSSGTVVHHTAAGDSEQPVAKSKPQPENTEARKIMMAQMKQNDEAENESDDDLPVIKILKTS